MTKTRLRRRRSRGPRTASSSSHERRQGPVEARGVFALLIEPLRQAVAEEGYTHPTPIQEQAIPHLLEGRDLLGCAQTGTGKTAAFVLPMLQHLDAEGKAAMRRHPRAIILTPTRELAAQIGDSIAAYGRHLGITHTVIFGGVGQQPQVSAMKRGVHIVVATPGRLLDLMQQGVVILDRIGIFVLDEADRMLDMGFIHDVRRVIEKLPRERHSLFFSATIQPPVVALAKTLVRDPVHVTVSPDKPTVEKIGQKVMFVDRVDKIRLLTSLLGDERMGKVLVFTRTKYGANKVTKKLLSAHIPAVAIHGNKAQTVRTRALEGFRNGEVRALVATDIAARGLDVHGITHVINFDLPVESEVYVHRVGRTARAGAGGNAISFCSAEERDALRSIERFIRKRVPVDGTHAWHSDAARDATGAAARPAPRVPRPPRGAYRVPRTGPRRRRHG
ncbi:MAG: DEAD/DEAH box helicase [Deltaproteobacteria bacterium]|nr:DEAD/DEAH box helicase [Deltaproteobacteria bacterium]